MISIFVLILLFVLILKIFIEIAICFVLIFVLKSLFIDICFDIVLYQLRLGVSTVETNRDRDRERPSCRDSLLKTLEIIHHVETRIFFFSVETFKIETFQSRLGCVKIFIEIVETNPDYRDNHAFSR